MDGQDNNGNPAGAVINDLLNMVAPGANANNANAGVDGDNAPPPAGNADGGVAAPAAAAQAAGAAAQAAGAGAPAAGAAAPPGVRRTEGAPPGPAGAAPTRASRSGAARASGPGTARAGRVRAATTTGNGSGRPRRRWLAQVAVGRAPSPTATRMGLHGPGAGGDSGKPQEGVPMGYHMPGVWGFWSPALRWGCRWGQPSRPWPGRAQALALDPKHLPDPHRDRPGRGAQGQPAGGAQGQQVPPGPAQGPAGPGGPGAAGPQAAPGQGPPAGGPMQWDPNLDANANMARAFFALAEATQAAQRRQERRQAEETLYGKANKECPSLSKADPVETVLDFFNEFEVVAMTNRWSDQRARLELRSAMKGSVAQTIMAVPVGHDVLPARAMAGAGHAVFEPHYHSLRYRGAEVQAGPRQAEGEREPVGLEGAASYPLQLRPPGLLLSHGHHGRHLSASERPLHQRPL